MRCPLSNGGLLFWQFQVVIVLWLEMVSCQSNSTQIENGLRGQRRPTNLNLESDQMTSMTPSRESISSTGPSETHYDVLPSTEIDDGPIPLEVLKSSQTPSTPNSSTVTGINAFASDSPGSVTESTRDDTSQNTPISSARTTNEHDVATSKLATSSDTEEPTRQVFSTTHGVSEGSKSEFPSATDSYTEKVISTMADSVEKSSSAKDISSEVPLVTKDHSYSTESGENPQSSENPSRSTGTDASTFVPVDSAETISSPVARPLVQTTSSATSTTNVGKTRTTPEGNTLPGSPKQTMTHSTRRRGNTLPLVSESWPKDPSTKHDYTSSFETSNDMTNNLLHTSDRLTTFGETHTSSTEDDSSYTTEDSTYVTEYEEYESSPHEVVVPVDYDSTTLEPTTAEISDKTTTEEATTILTTETQPEVELTTTMETTTTTPETTSTQAPSTTKEYTELPVLNITETTLLITSVENATTTEAIATTQRELEPYKYHEHLTNEETNNAVTVIFQVPPDQKMDVFWSIDRNNKFRSAVTYIINMEESNRWNNDITNKPDESLMQMDEPNIDVSTWLSRDDLVYISPSPVAENRSIYVAFFIRNSSTELYSIVSADKILNALTTNKPVLEEQMGLNITQITKGIILVKVVRPFFVRHAIIIISLLGVAVFCILIIIVTLICIRCRSSRRWDRGEYSDKSKLKQDMRLNRDIGDLNSDRDIQNDEPQMTEKGGYPYLNGNRMHVISLADEGWVVPLDQPPPLPPKPHAETEDTKL